MSDAIINVTPGNVRLWREAVLLAKERGELTPDLAEIAYRKVAHVDEGLRELQWLTEQIDEAQRQR